MPRLLTPYAQSVDWDNVIVAAVTVIGTGGAALGGAWIGARAATNANREAVAASRDVARESWKRDQVVELLTELGAVEEIAWTSENENALATRVLQLRFRLSYIGVPVELLIALDAAVVAVQRDIREMTHAVESGDIHKDEAWIPHRPDVTIAVTRIAEYLRASD